jgi:two-component system, OmpR family, alkaline phosphatase synthesis response regulator PhoP
MKRATVGNVIVADDDPMIRSVLQAKLETLGLNVFLTADGLEAVGLASRIPAALIILDLKMPKLNGLLACERIRQMPCNAQTPVAILTSTHEKSAEAAGLMAGATVFFTKPFRASLLMERTGEVFADQRCRTWSASSRGRASKRDRTDCSQAG